MTKIINKKASEKAIMMRNTLSLELLSIHLDVVRKAFWDCGLDLDPFVCDLGNIKETINESLFDHPELIEALTESPAGVGYLLGAAMAVLESSTLEGDDIEE